MPLLDLGCPKAGRRRPRLEESTKNRLLCRGVQVGAMKPAVDAGFYLTAYFASKLF